MRLLNQQIVDTTFKKPSQIVSWMIAMQAQEYAMAKWAVGLRLPGTTDQDLEDAFNKGTILRTHVMRPTWHFVAPEDIGWLLALTAPRVHALNAYMYRQTDLSEKTLSRAAEILAVALEGRKFLERAALQQVLEKKKIIADGMRLAYIIMYAELEGIVCSGPRKGNQFTYALLKERAPSARRLDREEALVQFVERYFISRGPATIKDFTYWSGLSMQDAKTGCEALSKAFAKEKVEGREYIWLPAQKDPLKTRLASFLMPDYDEYGMSYEDRSVLRSSSVKSPVIQYNRMLVIDGKIEGTWKRVTGKKEMMIETVPFSKLSDTKEKKLAQAVKRFRLFYRPGK